jgi:HEPN/Toprim N-terminal domain 1
MGSYGGLYVDGITVSRMKNGVPPDLCALFTDSMLRRRTTTAADYYSDPDLSDDEVVRVYELVAPSQIIADRLDVLGFDRSVTLARLDEALEDARARYADSLWTTGPEELQAAVRNDQAHLDGYAALDWVRELASASRRPGKGDRFTPGSLDWLFHHSEDLDYRQVLRAVVLALPDAEVRLDITDLVGGGWLDDPPNKLCSEGLAAMRADAAAHAPIIVLTEGRTDIQVLQPALDLLYPHLADLIRFMDYAERPEGGAGALVRTVRAFAAASVANRVVALFDNDTAANDALRNLDIDELPAGIRVLRYPRLALAAEYPTLGPPTSGLRTGGVARADVNGLAGSIELYLGRDVLTGPDGALRPVHWRTYIAAARQYQGEIVDKAALHEAYRAKVEAARMDPGLMATQDWSGMRAILDLIRGAFT